MRTLGIILGGFLSTAIATASPIKVSSRRLVAVVGTIDAGIMKTAQAVIKLSTRPGPITVVVNSPGGIISMGEFFENALDIARARGNKIVCVVTSLAASMAFDILTHCDERYALSSSLLLFHPARASTGGGSITATQAQTLADELTSIERPAKQRYLQMMGMDPNLFEKSYQAEKLWSATELVAASTKNWLTVTNELVGIDPHLFTDPTHQQRGPSNDNPYSD